jgi:hypothetical protein
MELSDILCTQILNLETLRDLLMTNDKSMELDPHGIASLMDGMIEGIKFVHDELLDGQ